MKIMVAVDFSKASSEVLSEARKFALNFSAKLLLIHVCEPDPDFVGYAPGPQTVRDQVADKFRDQHRRLQQEADKLAELGLEVTALMVQGATAETILKEADKLKADMIIVGSHGHGAVYHLLVGSVSEAVLLKAKCPVLVVPTHDRS